MSLAAGRRLGHYRITAAIGAGGMGEVYRAIDTKLGREVAIKVLPPELATDPERRARFEREAAVVAGLSHPNIVTVHSVEEDAGVHFITMELVEGRTLSDAIPPDGFPVEELLKIAIPIADAIGSAHAKGIVHRDLKPANIMLDADGRVKVLDFGLAKHALTAGEDDETAAATGHTRAGQLLGTVAYMSPEQAEGRPVDPKSDVFSLGIVLYQMATGRNPFQRGSAVSTLSAILKDAPEPVVAVKHSLPPVLGEILGRCLEKAPERRYASASELRDRLRDLHTTVTSGPLAPRPATLLETLRRPHVAAPAVLLLAGVLGLSAWLYHRSARTQWAREVALPEIERLLDASTGGPGLWQAYVLGREAERALPDDPLLQRLRSRYSNPLTDPLRSPGARGSGRSPTPWWTASGSFSARRRSRRAPTRPSSCGCGSRRTATSRSRTFTGTAASTATTAGTGCAGPGAFPRGWCGCPAAGRRSTSTRSPRGSTCRASSTCRRRTSATSSSIATR